MSDFDVRQKVLLPLIGLLSGLAIAAPGCDQNNPVINQITEVCDLTCPTEGIAEGNASISGIVSIDAFFSAVLEVRNAASNVSGTVRAELEGMAASLALEGYADLSVNDLSAAVAAEIQGRLQVLQSGLRIEYEPPKCQASVEVAVAAAAECDVQANPATIEARCLGSCEVSAEVAADCAAMGTLECTGQAPNFECSGRCRGDCQLQVAAACEGTCNGRCSGECSACTGGTCQTDGQGFVTNCTGSCSAGCEGTCKLEAGGSCSGSCEGECTYNPGGVGCEVGATASCDVSAMADVQCQGKCEGKVEPPEVSAECQASVEAKASASVECRPPSLSVEYQFDVNVDAVTQAEFRVWLEGFKTRFAALLAAQAKLEFVGEAAVGLVVAAGGAVRGSLEATASGDLDLQIAIGIGCALDEIEAVSTALAEAQAGLTASLSATAMIAAVVAG